MNFQPFCATPKSYVDFMRLKFDKLNVLNDRERFVYLSLVYANVTDDKRFRHNIYDDCFTVTAKMLTERLCKGYNTLLDCIGLIEIAHAHNKDRKSTRAYKLSLDAISATIEYFATHTEQTTFIYTGGKPFQFRKFKTAILSKNNGSTAKCRAFINPLVTINMLALERYIKELQNNTMLATSKDLQRRLISALKFRHEAQYNDNPNIGQGQILQQYTESASGRLYGCHHHLQNAPREVRQACLYGQTNYDFENCHYSIFAQLCNKRGIDTPAIDYYLNNKRELRYKLCKLYDLSVDQVKKCLLALIYGASLIRMGNNQEKNICSIKDIVKDAKIYDRLRQQKDFKAIYAEIKSNTAWIIEKHKTRRGITNIIGKALRISETNQRQQLAHIIQGYEVKMLHIVLADYGKDISLLQHDGFYSARNDIDTEALQAKIHLQTGFNMLISKEVSKNDKKKSDLAA